MTQPEGEPIPRRQLGRAEREALVVENLLLAKWVAGRYVGRGLDREDLDQAAMLGLMRAAEKFDPGRGAKFTTYAAWWCRQSVMRAIERESKVIRLPAHVVQALNRRARARARGERLPPPSECELAALRALRVTWPDEDEDRPLEIAGEDDEAGDMLLRVERLEAVREAVRSLPERLRTIIERRFGIGCEPENLREIGVRLGLSRERVRQLEADALTMLQESSKSLWSLLN